MRRLLLLAACIASCLVVAAAGSVSTYAVCNDATVPAPNACSPLASQPSSLFSSDTQPMTQLGYGLRVSAPVRLQRSIALPNNRLLLVLSHTTTLDIYSDQFPDVVVVTNPAPARSGLALVLVDLSATHASIVRVVSVRSMPSLAAPQSIACDHATVTSNNLVFLGFYLLPNTQLTTGAAATETRVVLTALFPTADVPLYAFYPMNPTTQVNGLVYVPFRVSDLEFNTALAPELPLAYELSAAYPRSDSDGDGLAFAPSGDNAFYLPCSADYHANATHFEAYVSCITDKVVPSLFTTLMRRALFADAFAPSAPGVSYNMFEPASYDASYFQLWHAAASFRVLNATSMERTHLVLGPEGRFLANPVVHRLRYGVSLHVSCRLPGANNPPTRLFQGPTICFLQTGRCTELRGLTVRTGADFYSNPTQAVASGTAALLAGEILVEQLILTLNTYNVETGTLLSSVPLPGMHPSLLGTQRPRLLRIDVENNAYHLVDLPAALSSSASFSLVDALAAPDAASIAFVSYASTSADAASVTLTTNAVRAGEVNEVVSPLNQTTALRLVQPAVDGRRSRAPSTVCLTLSGQSFVPEAALYAPLPAPRSPGLPMALSTSSDAALGLRMTWSGSSPVELAQSTPVVAHTRVWTTPGFGRLLNAANSLAMGTAESVQGLTVLRCCNAGQHVRWNADQSPLGPSPWIWREGTAAQATCPSSLGGARCEWPACATDGVNQCANGGVCQPDGTCLCQNGFVGAYCDQNACDQNPLLCQPGGQCVPSTIGPAYYQCTCTGEYSAAADGLSCLPPCSSTNPAAATYCTPFAPPATQYGTCVDPGSGACPAGSLTHCCQCNTGFEPSGSGSSATCVDTNECLMMNGGCDLLVSCTNTPGSRVCGACPAGYTDVGGGLQCVDINECAVNNGGCDANTRCTNLPGGYDCGAGRCPPGYSGDPNVPGGCTDIDECALAAPCDAPRACVNLPGSFECTACPAGYEDAPAPFGQTCFEPRNWTVSPLQVLGTFTLRKRQRASGSGAWHLFVEYSSGLTIANAEGATVASIDARAWTDRFGTVTCPSWAWIIFSADYGSLQSVTVVDSYTVDSFPAPPCFSYHDVVMIPTGGERAYLALETQAVRYSVGGNLQYNDVVASVRRVYPDYGFAAYVQPMVTTNTPGLNARQHVVLSFVPTYFTIVDALRVWISANWFAPSYVRVKLGAVRTFETGPACALVVATSAVEAQATVFSYALHDYSAFAPYTGGVLPIGGDGSVAVFRLATPGSYWSFAVPAPVPGAYFRAVAAEMATHDDVALLWTSPSAVATAAVGEEADPPLGWTAVWTAVVGRVRTLRIGGSVTVTAFRVHVAQAASVVGAGITFVEQRDEALDDSFLRVADGADTAVFGGSVTWSQQKIASVGALVLGANGVATLTQAMAEGYQRHMVLARAVAPAEDENGELVVGPPVTYASPSGAVITVVGSNWVKTISPTYGCGEGQVPAATSCMDVDQPL
jgi:hypothetical protein